MFDEEKEASDNRAAFAAAVKRINDEMVKDDDYKFVVVTGDIGIENLVSAFVERDGKRERRFEENKEVRDERIRKGATDLASIMAPSKVKVWLFVPGNNDLFNEEITTLNFYQQFIAELQKAVSPWGISVIDLCMARGNAPASGTATPPPAPYVEGPYAFIGFNDASFKNNNDLSRVLPTAKPTETPVPGVVSLNADQVRARQEEYVRHVLSDVGGRAGYAYVFYHIPEIDDPYLVSGGSEQRLLDTLLIRQQSLDFIGKANRYSSWFVAPSVRALWDGVVKDEKVRGLFAGHFHSKDREVYQSYRWMLSSEYPSGSLSKLYVCPPLAVKLQASEKTQARGFQEVSINKEGRVLGEGGKAGVRVFWYDPTTGTFNAGAVTKANEEALRQIQLGESFETSGRFKEAEETYTKALAAESPQLHNDALVALRRVVSKQVSPLNRYVFTPLGFSLSPEGVYLFLALCALLLVLALLRVLEFYLSGENKAVLVRDLALVAFALVFITVLFPALAVAVWGDFQLPSVITLILIVVTILACLCVLYFVIRSAKRLSVKRGQNQLFVMSLADTTNGKLAAILPSVFAVVREEFIKSRKFDEISSGGPTLPVVILEADTEMAELVETTVPGRWGTLLGWLFRRTSKPAYTVRTALQSAGGSSTLIMSVSEGEDEKVWSAIFVDALLHEKQKDLAHEVLIHIFRRINYGVDYDDAS